MSAIEQPPHLHHAQPRTLIADDQPHVVEALRLLLKNEGIQSDAAQSPAAVLDQVKSRSYDVLLMDLNYARDTTSGEEGLDLLKQVQAIDNTLPVVAMTAWGSVELAVEAMKRGVCDFVLKPWENSRLTRTLWNHIERGRSKRDQLRRQREDDDAERAAGRALLPQSLPRVPGFEIAATVQPLDTLGGDYFDVLEPAEGRLALAIADAIGKGVPAALLMSNVQASVRALAGSGFSPAELAASLNHSVKRNTTAGRFVTFFYSELNTRARAASPTSTRAIALPCWFAPADKSNAWKPAERCSASSRIGRMSRGPSSSRSGDRLVVLHRRHHRSRERSRRTIRRGPVDRTGACSAPSQRG